MVDFMPPHGCVLAPDICGDSIVSYTLPQSTPVANKEPSQLYIPAIRGVYSILQVPSHSILASSIVSDLSPAPMDMHQESIFTAFVAVS